jgi:hypothetical protein
LLITRGVEAVVETVHGAGLEEPFSNPGLPRICVVPPPPPDAVTVRETLAVWVTPPPVAVKVTVDVPVTAVLLAVKVSVELPLPGAAIDVGLKLAVTPEGKPEAERESAELNPPLTVVESVVLPVLPWTIDTLAGETLTAKSGVAAAVIVSETVVVCVTPPPVAVTVTVDVPVTAVLLAVKVSAEFPLPGAAIDAGLKLAVTPEGKPEAENEIAELNPPLTVVESFVLPVLPWTIDTLAGEALTAKSGVAVEATVSATVVVCVTPPPLAVTVTFAVPTVAVPLAVRVSVALPLPGAAMEVGLKLAVTPVGNPEAESDTDELNPPLIAVVIVVLPELP